MKGKDRINSSGSVDELMPRSLLECRQRLNDLIFTYCNSNHLGVSFSDDYWDIAKRTRSSSAGEGGVWFSLEKVTRSGEYQPFPHPFSSFMKLMVCLYDMRSDRGFAIGQMQTLVAAGRYLHSVMVSLPDPAMITGEALTAAALLAAERQGSGAKNVGSMLAFIGREVSARGLCTIPFTWTNPNKSLGKLSRTDKAADDRRRKLLPSPEVLDALADISATASETLHPRDLLLQRAIDLLVCTGFRVNELLSLPRDPLVLEPVIDENGIPLLDRRGQAVVGMGIRYWPEKGGSTVTRIKLVPTIMQDVVRRAVDDILAITETSADVARFQAANPGRTLLQHEFRGRADPLTTRELAIAVGLRPSSTMPQGGMANRGQQFAKINGIPMTPVPQRVSVRDVEEALYRRSYQGDVLRDVAGRQNITESLFVVPSFFVSPRMDAGVVGTVEMLTDAQLNVYMVGLKNGTQSSIFERLEMRAPDGANLKVTYHQFRHWLSTIAAEGGLVGVEQARWMARKNPAQNAAYDHVTPVERARAVREAIGNGHATGPVAEVAGRIREPVRREEFVAAAAPTAHMTELGICVHDWDAAPCPKHGACATCDKTMIVKGDSKTAEAARREYIATSAMLDAAKAEDADGTYGASRWVEAQQHRLRQLDRILVTHADPAIIDGTMVQLSRDGSGGLESTAPRTIR
jgi:hypothetical protein